MIRTLFKYFFILTCIFYAGPASAATYYVATNGSDSNAGTQSSPFRTIGKALSVIGTSAGAGAGKIIEVSAGTYDERIIGTLPKGSSWANPFTLKAKAGDIVNIKSTNTDGYSTFYFSGGGNYYSIIDGFVIDGALVQNSTIYVQAASYLRFQNLEVKNANNNHFYVYVDAIGIEILNSKIHDGLMFAGGLYNHGIYFSGSNGLIEGNDIYNVQGYGVHIYADSSYPAMPSNNIVRKNTIHNFGLGRYANGIHLGSGSGNMAYNNVVYHGRSKGIVSGNGATNSKIYNNTIYDIYDPANADGTGIWAPGGSDTVRNNIVYQVVTGDMVNCGSGSICDHNFISNPNFVNAGAGDFHLTSTSGVINYGIVLSEFTTDKDGNARVGNYDAGAYEYGGTVPTPTPTPASNTYYVATTGSDSNAGTITAPFRTIAKALRTVGTAQGVGANKVVEVSVGIYTDSLDENSTGHIYPSGTSWSAPFTLRAKTGDTVTIKINSGINMRFWSDTNAPFYTIIHGFIFDGTYNAEDQVSLGSCCNGASYVRFTNNQFINTGNGVGNSIYPNGIIIGRFSNNVEFINNKFIGGSFGDGGTACGQTKCYGYPFYWQGSNGLIEGNEIYNFPSYGIHMYSGYTEVPNSNIIRNNKIHDFGFGDSRGNGILLASGNNNAAYNNIVWNGSTAVGSWYGTNQKVYNNTVYNMSVAGINLCYSSGSIIKNNILYQASMDNCSGTASNMTQSNNLLSNTGFTNLIAGDFHLTSSATSAIDQGASLGAPYNIDFDGVSRPQGTAYDIGAYEYVSGSTVLIGDLNGDKIVNSLDWSLMSAKWLTNDTSADLNKDGAVNSLDWSIMSSNWLKTI